MKINKQVMTYTIDNTVLSSLSKCKLVDNQDSFAAMSKVILPKRNPVASKKWQVKRNSRIWCLFVYS